MLLILIHTCYLPKKGYCKLPVLRFYILCTLQFPTISVTFFPNQIYVGCFCHVPVKSVRECLTMHRNTMKTVMENSIRSFIKHNNLYKQLQSDWAYLCISVHTLKKARENYIMMQSSSLNECTEVSFGNAALVKVIIKSFDLKKKSRQNHFVC